MGSLFGKEGEAKYFFIKINASPPLRLKHEHELTGPMTAERVNLALLRCRFVRTQRVGMQE